MTYEQSSWRRREEQLLFTRFARDHDAASRDALVERFLPLARRLAFGFRGREDMDDLEQVAAIGLVKAIDRFDPHRGLAFASFASPTIVGELKRHFRDRCWAVRVPRSVQELAVRIERVSTQLVGELGRAPTIPELAVAADATTERVQEALRAIASRQTSSLQALRDDAVASAERDVSVEDPGFSVVEDAVMLDMLLDGLPPRDRLVIELRFREDRLQWQIAELVGVSQMHVSRVIRSSLEQLRLAAGTG
jgi:RNA polymerase sigma-B factor